MAAQDIDDQDRPGFGEYVDQELNEALSLISKMRGQWYDSVHKEECLALLKKHGQSLPE
jgi:hypothetical protein